MKIIAAFLEGNAFYENCYRQAALNMVRWSLI